MSHCRRVSNGYRYYQHDQLLRLQPISPRFAGVSGRRRAAAGSEAPCRPLDPTDGQTRPGRSGLSTSLSTGLSTGVARNSEGLPLALTILNAGSFVVAIGGQDGWAKNSGGMLSVWKLGDTLIGSPFGAVDAAGGWCTVSVKTSGRA